ncbi:hypothetical protein HRI_001776500 [Hibiscus trionum]|uniref:Uncharacterized protein n=1 Tax=Hibiscus trionum TaxID=183268 RepID=A0A9W7HQF0_HIBTR|nr:hypothetical protein HRI_001776500 [Hibiscus trionum]
MVALSLVQYNGIDNFLAVENVEVDRGYWDLDWSLAGTKGTRGKFDKIESTSFEVVVENEDQVDLSFTRTWDQSLEGKVVPLNIDKRFVMLSDPSGFYTYAIYEHLKEWLAFILNRFRVAFKLKKDKYAYVPLHGNSRQQTKIHATARCPISAYRMNTMVNQEKASVTEGFNSTMDNGTNLFRVIHFRWCHICEKTLYLYKRGIGCHDAMFISKNIIKNLKLVPDGGAT